MVTGSVVTATLEGSRVEAEGLNVSLARLGPTKPNAQAAPPRQNTARISIAAIRTMRDFCASFPTLVAPRERTSSVDQPLFLSSPVLMKTPTSFHPNLIAPSISPLPCTRGRGVGGEGASSAQECRVSRGILTPSPLPLSPEYRGEGTAQQIGGKWRRAKCQYPP